MVDRGSCIARLAGARELAPLSTKAPHLSLAGETNIAWTYHEASPEVGPIEGRIAFYDEWVDVEIDGESQERQVTASSGSASSHSLEGLGVADGPAGALVVGG